MGRFNTKAIAGGKIFEGRTKIENLSENYTCTLDTFSIIGELVVVTPNEDKTTFFFASGSLKEFILDNTDIAETNDGEIFNFKSCAEITITYKGKKKSKKTGYFYNSWNVSVEEK